MRSERSPFLGGVLRRVLGNSTLSGDVYSVVMVNGTGISWGISWGRRVRKLESFAGLITLLNL